MTVYANGKVRRSSQPAFSNKKVMVNEASGQLGQAERVFVCLGVNVAKHGVVVQERLGLFFVVSLTLLADDEFTTEGLTTQERSDSVEGGLVTSGVAVETFELVLSDARGASNGDGVAVGTTMATSGHAPGAGGN